MYPKSADHYICRGSSTQQSLHFLRWRYIEMKAVALFRYCGDGQCIWINGVYTDFKLQWTYRAFFFWIVECSRHWCFISNTTTPARDFKFAGAIVTHPWFPHWRCMSNALIKAGSVQLHWNNGFLHGEKFKLRMNLHYLLILHAGSNYEKLLWKTLLRN